MTHTIKPVELLVVVLIFAALAVATTWPLAAHLTDRFVAGSNDNDVRFNIWVIFWGAHALSTNPLELHHTNMFYPERYTFNYSEIELAHTLLMWPVIAVFYDPILTYHLLVILSLLIGGIGFYLLGRDLVHSRIAAFLGAAVFLFNPAHFGRYMQIQLFGDHWLPWFIWALQRWLRSFEKTAHEEESVISRRIPWAVATVIFYCLNALSGSHLAVFGTFIGGAFAVYFLTKNRLWTSAGVWLGLAAMAAATALILVPIFLPYTFFEKELADHRIDSPEILLEGSAGPLDLFSAGSHFYRWLDAETGWPSSSFRESPRGFLFPGFIPLFLAAFGFFQQKKEKTERTSAMRWLAWLLDLLVIAAAISAAVIAMTGTDTLMFFVLQFTIPFAWIPGVIASVAFALRFFIPGKAEHVLPAFIRFLRERFELRADRLFWLGLAAFASVATLGLSGGLYWILAKLPLIKLIRVPRRFIQITTFALAVLSVFGADALQRKFGKNRRKATVVIALVILLFAVEANYVPIQLFPADPPPPEVYRWLGTQEGEFTVAEFPINVKGYPEFIRQVYNSIYHWKNLLVGYSGFQSRENEARLRRLNNTFPSDSCLDELRELKVRYVLVFESRLDSKRLELLRRQDALEEMRHYGNLGVYQLVRNSD